ncbi:MAG: hypothetical protein HY200_09260 [Nitrospirae bacterium]|nr:hypothetical protein [Nitrospirota bacterium]MBI3595132.1 hypothetical protein [Nitrospirota bacterium]
MDDFDPILNKLEDRFNQFIRCGEVMKLMDLLARQGLWIDFSIQPGGPGLLTGEKNRMVPSPLKDEVLCRMYRWMKDYDRSFLKANKIKE